MHDYLEDILKKANERGEMNRTAMTPVSDDLIYNWQNITKIKWQETKLLSSSYSKISVCRKES